MILLTGATGFVGQRTAYALRVADLAVRALVRDPGQAGRLTSWGCELTTGDMTDRESLARAVDGCETVVHLVAIISGRAEDFDRVMTRGTQDLLAAASAEGVRRIVLMSSLGTSEQTKDRVPYYGAKWEMEQAVAASDLEHVILRPSFVFGPDGGALPRFLKIVRYLPATPIPGAGTQQIQPIWVDDVAAYVRAAVGTGAAGQTFELGGPNVVTWNDLWARIARALGKRRRELHLPISLLRFPAAVLERAPGAPLTRDQLTMLELGDNTCDIQPAVETLGVMPIGLDEQLRRAVARTA